MRTLAVLAAAAAVAAARVHPRAVPAPAVRVRDANGTLPGVDATISLDGVQ
jgi:hypothetical protein